jgi:hypothetical protein
LSDIPKYTIIDKDLRNNKNIEVYQPEDSDIIQLNIPILIKRWNDRKLIITSENGNIHESTDTEPTALQIS